MWHYSVISIYQLIHLMLWSQLYQAFLQSQSLSPEWLTHSQVCYFDLADINHLKTTSSEDSYFLAFIFFLFKLIFADENTAIIFFLLAGKSHVEIVLLGTPYFCTIYGLSWPLFISCNALNFSSMEVRFFCCDLDMFLWLLQRCKKLHTSGKNFKPSNFAFIFKFFKVPFFLFLFLKSYKKREMFY